MNKMLKYLPISLILVFYVSGCGMLANRIEDKIELVGSELTGVSVDVDEVSLHIARGQGEIKGFKIANPEGYTADYLMDWQLMELNLGILSTVAGDPIVLDKLVISYPVVNFEKNKRGGSNLKDVAENTKKNTNIADQKSIEEDSASGETPEEPVRIIIRELIIEGITLNVLRADGSTRSAILPSIRMTDVGGDEGKTPAGLGVVIIGAMSGEMIKQIVARELIERAGDIQEALSTENILEVFDNKLNLTPGQRDKIRPIIESLSTALTSTIDIWVIQGYVNLDEFGKQLVPLKKDLEIQLKNVLDSRQFKDIKG
ncbi:MAG: hypothetical protein KAR01_13005, partial [Desulfocapsa sp.]|nr:hypothetical protein [Desulfocapsa sp.]